jgi:hypothetical protein
MVQKVFETKPAEGSRRSRISDLNNNLDVKYAVFRRSLSGKSAQFRTVHQDIETATEVARTHASEAISRGDHDFTFYVVELKHRVGIEHGKLVDIRME